MPRIAAPVVGLRGRSDLLGRELAFPRAILIGDDFNPRLHLLQRTAIHKPDHLAARLAIAILNADHIADLQFMFKS